MISGKLQADMPAVTFNPGPGDFVAFVNNNTITASGTGNACNVTVDDRATSSVDNLVCFFEWLPNTSGFTANGFNLTGIPNAAGELKLPYKISYFSGSERQKVEVVNGWKIASSRRSLLTGWFFWSYWHPVAACLHHGLAITTVEPVRGSCQFTVYDYCGALYR